MIIVKLKGLLFNITEIRSFCMMFFLLMVVTSAFSQTMERKEETPQLRNGYSEAARTPRLSIGTNLLYLAALAPNVTAEYYFPDSHWSVSAAFTMPWWKKESKNRFYQIRQYLAEGRYWMGDSPVKGHFLGYNIHGGLYDLENKRTGYYGEFVGTSLTYGYKFRLNKNLALELSVGGGYIYTNYDKYLPIDGCYMYQSTHNTHYWGVTKAGISLIWNILY